MSASDFILTPSAVTSRPEMNSVVPMIVERRMFRSTILPKNAAPMPRKKMPSENAHWTFAINADIAAFNSSGRLNTSWAMYWGAR